ncbi:MAG: hypothetical protein AB8F78_19855 [Saprospiraceae bacterium]
MKEIKAPTFKKILLLVFLVIFLVKFELPAQSIAFGGSLGLMQSLSSVELDERYLGTQPTGTISLSAQFEPKYLFLNRKITIGGELMRIERQFALKDVRPNGGPAPFSEAVYATYDYDIRVSAFIDLIKPLQLKNLKGTFRPKAGIIAAIPIAREEIRFDFVAPQGFPTKIEYFQARPIDSGFILAPGLAVDFSYEHVFDNSNYSIIIGVNASYYPLKNQRYEITFDHEDTYSSRIVNHSRSGANLYVLLGINRG